MLGGEIIDKEIFIEMGNLGLLGSTIPEEFEIIDPIMFHMANCKRN